LNHTRTSNLFPAFTRPIVRAQLVCPATAFRNQVISSLMALRSRSSMCSRRSTDSTLPPFGSRT